MQPQQTENHDSQARMMRGMEMLQNGTTVRENEDGSFAVPSQTSAKTYEVRILGQRMVCTCPDFEYRQIEACKHIHLVKFTLSVKFMKDEPKPKVFAADAIPCDKCGSIRTMKYGKSGNKQTYYCKDCHRKFRESSLLKKARFTPEFVTLCLDLYFSGLSLRKITRTLSTHFNIDVNFATIYRWIAKYVPMVSQYVNSLAPQLSTTWHADELFVRLKGGEKVKGGATMGYIWNIMDRETRFLIVSKLTTNRDVDSTVEAFIQSSEVAHGIKPKTVFTDSLRNYQAGVRKSYLGADHVSGCGIRGKSHINNNRIERLNSTLRERTKVARGWKTVNTPMAEGQRIHYNFVKPHMALEGKTPAQEAGMVLEGKDKWLEMIKAAAHSKNS